MAIIDQYQTLRTIWIKECLKICIFENYSAFVSFGWEVERDECCWGPRKLDHWPNRWSLQIRRLMSWLVTLTNISSYEIQNQNHRLIRITRRNCNLSTFRWNIDLSQIFRPENCWKKSKNCFENAESRASVWQCEVGRVKYMDRERRRYRKFIVLCCAAAITYQNASKSLHEGSHSFRWKFIRAQTQIQQIQKANLLLKHLTRVHVKYR